MVRQVSGFQEGRVRGRNTAARDAGSGRMCNASVRRQWDITERDAKPFVALMTGFRFSSVPVIAHQAAG